MLICVRPAFREELLHALQSFLLLFCDIVVAASLVFDAGIQHEVEMHALTLIVRGCHYSRHHASNVAALDKVSILAKAKRKHNFVDQSAGLDGSPVLIMGWVGRQSVAGKRGCNDVVWQIVRAVLLLQVLHERDKLEKRPWPSVKKSNRDCVWLGGEEGNEVDIVALAVIILDVSLEVG